VLSDYVVLSKPADSVPRDPTDVSGHRSCAWLMRMLLTVQELMPMRAVVSAFITLITVSLFVCVVGV